jgi:hypothetical protein
LSWRSFFFSCATKGATNHTAKRAMAVSERAIIMNSFQQISGRMSQGAGRHGRRGQRNALVADDDRSQDDSQVSHRQIPLDGALYLG